MKIIPGIVYLGWTLFLPISLLAQPVGTLVPSGLHCDADLDPAGVDVPQPVLGWQLTSPARADNQTAYQLLVASSREGLAGDHGDLWDSGQIKSGESVQVLYAGKPLRSAQRVFWKVRVWDQENRCSAWSDPASWTMGLLDPADWQGAKWIVAPAGANFPTTRLRRSFTVKPGLQKAVAFVCGLGQYEMTLDGRKVGDDLLSPGWSNYRKTCFYDTHDVTALVQQSGTHAVGLLLGNGMYNVEDTKRYKKFVGSFGPQKAIAQLRLEYEDGTSEIIGTDDTWRVGPGPITFSHEYGGEDYDARLEQKGWDTAPFDASGWTAATVADGPGGKLSGHSCAAPPVRAVETFRPASSREIRPDVVVYDLGQNAAMMPRLIVRGPAGSTVKITPAELLHEDGSVDRGSVGGGDAYWKYTLAGGNAETYFPKFYYQGCRYLQVECSPPEKGGELPQVVSLEGVAVHSAAAPAGEFTCSNELFNRIRTLVRWAQRSNSVSLLTDCPARERLGWLEQDHLNGPALRYEFRLDRLFAKITGDMIEAQQPDGLVPDIAPEFVVFKGGFRDSPEWGSAIVLVPWQQYEWTGSTDVLQRAYEAMKGYVDYLGRRAENGIVSYGLGDWYDLGPKPPGRAQLTPTALTATAFYFQDATVLAQTARLLGKSDDATHYTTVADQIRDAFNTKFFQVATAQYASGSQTANALALATNLVDPAKRQAVLDCLVQDVRAHDNAITAGDVGYRYVLRALADGGRSDVVFDMNNQSEKPGYGMMLACGATALTEAWDQKGAHGGSSQDHFMLGQITEWFYRDLAGIAPDPTGPGFRRIIVHPRPVGNVTAAKASYASVRGRVSVKWQKERAGFRLRVDVPPGSSATVFVPSGGSANEITESGGHAADAFGVRFLRTEPDATVFEVSSGQYEFLRDFQKNHPRRE